MSRQPRSPERDAKIDLLRERAWKISQPDKPYERRNRPYDNVSDNNRYEYARAKANLKSKDQLDREERRQVSTLAGGSNSQSVSSSTQQHAQMGTMHFSQVAGDGVQSGRVCGLRRCQEQEYNGAQTSSLASDTHTMPIPSINCVDSNITQLPFKPPPGLEQHLAGGKLASGSEPTPAESIPTQNACQDITCQYFDIGDADTQWRQPTQRSFKRAQRSRHRAKMHRLNRRSDRMGSDLEALYAECDTCDAWMQSQPWYTSTF